MCDLERLGSACAYAQSDQCLSKSLNYTYSMSVKQLIEYDFEFLSLMGGCTGSYESTVVKAPHCWKSYAAAHVLTATQLCYRVSYC